MKRNTFIIIITLLLQIIVTIFAKVNNIMWLQAGITVCVPTFFMSMLVLCVYNRNILNWMDKPNYVL